MLDDALLLVEGAGRPADEPVPVVPEVLPLSEGEALPLADGDVVEPDVPPLTEPLAPLDELPGPAVGAMPPGETVLPLALLPAGGQSCELGALPLPEPLEL